MKKRASTEIDTSTKAFSHRQDSPQYPSLHLTVSPVALGVLALPGVAAAGRGVVVAVALVDTTGLLAGSGETTALAVLNGEMTCQWIVS
jgi:hypothetical protein